MLVKKLVDKNLKVFILKYPSKWFRLTDIVESCKNGTICLMISGWMTAEKSEHYLDWVIEFVTIRPSVRNLKGTNTSSSTPVRGRFHPSVKLPL
jgi:hypothetical protein